MGKLRKKHNWKGRQQSDPQPPDEKKTDIVVELKGKNSKVNSTNCIVIYIWSIFPHRCVVCLALACNSLRTLFSSDGGRLKGVDESNALVLPATKAKQKKTSVTPARTKRPLTKKQRKELQKVLERKEKKAQVRDSLMLQVQTNLSSFKKKRYFSPFRDINC